MLFVLPLEVDVLLLSYGIFHPGDPISHIRLLQFGRWKSRAVHHPSECGVASLHQDFLDLVPQDLPSGFTHPLR